MEVYGLQAKYLGEARGFGEAKRMQLASLPDDLKDAYAGVSHTFAPLFYTHMLTPELLAKYPQIGAKDDGVL